MKKALVFVALCALMAPNAHAGNFTEGWSGEASVSGSKTTGNTDTTDFGLALHVKKAGDVWRHSFDTTYDLGKVSGSTNKDRAYIGYQLDRKINDKFYVYGNANYFLDEFGAFKNGSFLGAGVGYQVIKTEPMQWALEGGAGYRSQKTHAQINPLVASATVNEFALRANSDFDYRFNDAVSLYNNSEILWSESDTYIWNDVGITANLAGNLAARMSFRVDNHSTVPVGRKKTDTITRVALVYTLK